MRLVTALLLLAAAQLAAPAQAQAQQATQQAPLKIGVLLPTSGIFAVIGNELLNGMRMAADEAGAGVAGRKLELIVEDTETKPDVGLAKARKLVLSDKVDAVAGIVSSAVALAVAPYLTSQKVPLVIGNAATDLLSGEKCSRYVFRAAYSSSQVSRPVGTWLASKGVKSVFVLGADFIAAHEFVKAFKESYTAGGGKVLGEAFSPFGKTQDYGPYISQARASNADGLFAVYFGGEAILFMKQYEAFGIKDKLPIYSTLGITAQMLHKAQGPAALGVISSAIYIPELDTPANKKFVATYQDKFKALPAEFAVMGYDSIRFILEAVRARNGDTADREALVDALEKSSFVSPRGPMKMDPKTRGATQNIYIVRTVPKGDGVGFEMLETLPNVPDPVTGCVLK